VNKFISPLPRQCEEAFIIRPPFGLPEAAAIAAVRCHHKDEPVGHSGTAASRPQRSEASHAAPGRSGNSPRATRGSFGKPRKAPSGPEPPLPAAPPSTPVSPRAHTPCVPSPGLAAGARSRRFLPSRSRGGPRGRRRRGSGVRGGEGRCRAAGPGPRGVGAADPAAFATLPALPAERCPCGRADGCGDRALLRGASPAAEPGGALLAGGNCCALEGRLFPQGRRYSGGEKKRVLLRGAVRLCKVETTTSMPPNAHARPRAVPSRGRSYPAAPHWLSRSSGLV